mmetsp:Transcript_3905/g.5902  ORF Transcript_3905/g.5902 Transcript_3905/m.5902 type:complete len:483 (-) Transcript_3905:43-1491(-)
MNEYIKIQNNNTGEVRIEKGEKLVFLGPFDEILEERRTALSLKANEFVRFIDNQTGKVRVVRGELGCVVPGPDEDYLDVGGKVQAMNLKVWEYVKIQDTNTGEVRTEKGEKLVFLGSFEEYLDGKKEAIEVDEETSVLVRNKRSGQQHLVTEKILFVPSNDEEILEVRPLIKLADYEACVVRDKTGKDAFFFGADEEQRSFFLPPYSELVQMVWSRGRRRERRDLIITKLDLRPMYMSFEFNCRTNDNVELVLEGSFFWEVTDLQSMIKFTSDTTGDICNHARSRFIELVSKVTLQEFMTRFNVIAKDVHQSDTTNFYSQRGVKIHSLEVTGYRCASRSTATILEQIIQETTNRMNKLQQQESENEVQLQEIRGDIEEEKAMEELIKIKTLNSNAKSRMEGLAEAEKVKSFLDGISTTFPDMDTHTKIGLWNTLRKEDALHAISKGSASLYFTPNDVNLSIENHEHVNKRQKSWVDDSVSED